MSSSLPSIFPSNFSSIGNIFVKKPQPPTPAQVAAKLAAERAELARAEREAERVQARPPENTSTTGRPSSRGRRVIERKPCICQEIFGQGSFKKAHNLQCAVGDICDDRLKQYTEDKFVALLQSIDHNDEITVEQQWKYIKDEIERQQQFYPLLALDIPLILLKFKSADNPTEFIYKDEFTEQLYKRDYPIDLDLVILIMQRMRPAGPGFDVLGLAEKLIKHRVLSCDYKYDNTGEYGEVEDSITVLSDWDTQYQTYIGDDTSNDRKLVCFMMLEYIIHQLARVIIKSKEIDAELENRINLFTHVRGQLKQYYPSIFIPETGAASITDVLNTAYSIFEKDGDKDKDNGWHKGLAMFQNLNNYNPLRLLVRGHKEEQLDGDIHKLIRMNLTYPLPNTMSIVEQIKAQYVAFSGGSRKRPKTKRRRSHKKKKGTRKMFR